MIELKVKLENEEISFSYCINEEKGCYSHPLSAESFFMMADILNMIKKMCPGKKFHDTLIMEQQSKIHAETMIKAMKDVLILLDKERSDGGE